MAEVAIGQIWQDNDPRMCTRELGVRLIVGDYAYCAIRIKGNPWEIRRDGKERLVRILTRRFRPNSTGYRLIG
jgi:hypothetical protein